MWRRCSVLQAGEVRHLVETEISCDIDIEFDISSHFEFVASILVLFTWDRQHRKIYLIVRPRVKCTSVIPTRLLPVYERPVLNKETEMKKCSKIRPSSNMSTGIIYSPESANHQKKRNYFWAQQHFCLVRKTRSWPVQKNSLWFPIINNDTYDVLAPQYLIQEIAYKSHLLLLGKFEYGGGPIFKVVLEC